jgi:hypothetical protein
MADDRPINVLDSRHKAINFIQGLTVELKQELAARPGQEDPLTSRIYGAIRYAQAMGDITLEQFEALKLEVTAITVKAAANVEMGNRG